MRRSLRGLFMFVSFALLATPAHAQATPGELLIGHWECTAPAGNQEYERITADYGADGAMAIKFYYVRQGGRVRMSMLVSGAWRYDAAAGGFNQDVTAAHIDDITVDGRPMARADHPAGEAGIAQQEERLVATFGPSAFVVTTLDRQTLVLTDRGGTTLTCAR